MRDPLRELPTLHVLLDVVENRVLESKSAEGGDAVQKYYYETYRPDPEEMAETIRRELESGSAEQDFDAFAKMVG